MAGNGRKTADGALALALAAGLTVESAATKAGISPRTAARRLADRTFRQQVAELRGEMVSRALGKLADAAADAVATLKKLLTAEADSVKLGAARSVLELGNKLRESVELEERLQALEKAIEAKNKGATLS